MEKQIECPKCKSYKHKTDRELITATGLALIFIAPWVLFFLVWFLGILAVWIAAGIGGLGLIMCLIALFGGSLSNELTCDNCNYKWTKIKENK